MKPLTNIRLWMVCILFGWLGALSLDAQTISGTVTDDTGEPVIGAGVLIKGTTSGTITDIDGKYTINAVKGDVIEISSIGFATAELTVGDEKVLDVTLKPDNLMLQETVVVGYGTQKKVNLTGAVAVVDSEQLKSRQSSTLGGMLQGTMPNVNITFGSGQAGKDAVVNIRGVTSIASSTGPLILVDGVEMNMSDVNPNDVESISVLKDASAAAVYGSRAAFGVVLITTKGASEGKATVTYNGKFSFGDVTTCTDFETTGYNHAYILDMFGRTYQGQPMTSYTAEDYHELWIRRNDKTEVASRPWVVETEDGQYKYYGNFDWYNFLYDNLRPTWDHNLSVQGGTDKIKYFISGNFYDQKGTMRINPDRYTHYTVRGKVTADVKPWLQMSLNTNFSSRNFDWPGTTSSINDYYNDTFLNALASIVPMHPDGTLVYRTNVWNDNSHTVTNGVSAMALYGKHQMKSSYNEFRIKGEAVIKPIKQLDINLNYTFTNLQNNHLNRFVEVPYSREPGVISMMDLAATENKIQESFNLSQRHVANVFATYQDKFAGDHDLKVMAGFNYENMYYKKNYMRRYGLLSDDLADFNLAVGDQYYTSGGQDRYVVMGFFFRGNYSWKDRYLVEVSGRYDGSSRFARGHRWGFFPSFSLGWRLSEEDFFAPARNLVDNLKIRFSYGGLGNQAAVGYYDYVQTISTSSQMNYAFEDNQKAYYAQETNPNSTSLSWEKVYTSNLGVDLTMFKGKLAISIDGYIRDTKDMIMQAKALPSTYGATAPKDNSADLRTYGGELSVSWNDSHEVAGDPFHYYVTAGLGDNVSFITRFDNPNKTLSDPYVGQKLGDIWGYKTGGLFASDEEAFNYPVDQRIVNTLINQSAVDPGVHAGDVKFLDLDGNGVLEKTTSANDVKDMVIIGNSLPRLNYSFTLGFDWKGIDFSMMFQGIGWQNWYPGMDCTLFWGPYARPYTSFVGKDFMSKVWSESNPDAYLPRPRGYVANKENRELSEINDRYLQNLGYLRLKNLTLGYSLPKKWMDAIHLQKIRFFFSGENLLTFTALKSRYIDPEQASASNTWQNCRSSAQVYPYAMTFTFGIDVVF
ncbi:MAG: TonB-dependent receptor [Bacteroidales bacterium]|nr:TonB-dependent receptor [Bacteroidales bacterium]